MLFPNFHGFKTVADLKASGLDEIPLTQGVYIVLIEKGVKPEFLKEIVGGYFKGRNPTVPISRLEEKWLQNKEILYIGKAGGEGSTATLRKRIKEYIKFGSGKPAAHWGGRLIWQLKDSDNLVFCWQETAGDPSVLESELLAIFKGKYGRHPFANLRK